MKCPGCATYIDDDATEHGCGWTLDAKSARERQWDDLTQRQDTAKERIWRALVKSREDGWPRGRRDAEVKRLLDYADICLSCQHGIVIMERHHPTLGRVAKRQGWDPILEPVEQRSALCDHHDDRTGRRCELGAFRADAQKDLWGINQTRSAAEAHGWTVARGPGEKADGTVQREADEEETLRSLADYEIDLRETA